MDKLERLLNLITALLETTRPLTADELRARVPGYPENLAAFRRSFERDKDDLRDMGIPLVYEPVPGIDPPIDGYRIDRSRYYLRDPGFEPDELAALNLAATAVTLDGVEGVEGLWKLGGVVEAVGEEPAIDGALAALPADPNLPALYQACTERRTASFTYNDELRTVEPQRVGYQRGHWYLTGWDQGRQGERNFRLDRIDGPVGTSPPGAFTRRSTGAGLPGDPWLLGEGDEVVARLLVDPDQATWAARQLGDKVPAEARDDGSVVFDVAVTNWPAFRSFVLTFLDHAEVLGPPELRSQMVEWLREVGP
ncbi:MAG: helix-turn-helix transcriptional regulator [Acidimicrobiales bacterium]